MDGVRTILRDLRKQLYYKLDQLKYPPHQGITWLGTEYGGAFVLPQLIQPHAAVFSIGVGCDISLDLNLIDRFNCRVYGFDPTPISIEWIKEQELPSGFQFCPWGIASMPGNFTFYLPSNPNHVSGSLTRNLGGGQIACEFKTLSESASELGVSRLALLKMDIEGEEYRVLPDLFGNESHRLLPDIAQMWVEFHPQNMPANSLTVENILGVLGKHGFSIAKKHYDAYLLVKNKSHIQ
jgi:FkbM family methyltransferase